MRMKLAATGLMVWLFGTFAFAHRLDEYLQATTITLAKGRVQAQLRLTPGVAVFAFVLPTIDTNGDGKISSGEQRAYAEKVLGDLALAVDGDRLKLQLVSTKYAEIEAMREGRGEIQVDFAAAVHGDRSHRRLVFENYHQRGIGTYLVNCLVPEDPDIRVQAQTRSYDQALYRLEYVESGVRSGPQYLTWWPDGRGWLVGIAMLLMARLAVRWRMRRV